MAEKSFGSSLLSGLSKLTRVVLEKTEVKTKTEAVLHSVKVKADRIIEDVRRRSSKTDLVLSTLKEQSAAVAQSVRE
jgi:hypothetical protein